MHAKRDGNFNSLNQLPSFSDLIYFGNVYEDRLSACNMLLTVLVAISKEKMHTKSGPMCEVHFCFEENIVRTTLNS